MPQLPPDPPDEPMLPFGPAPTQAERRFLAFHADNPHVYEKFLELVTIVRLSGRKKWSARSVIHRLRWFAYFETDDPNWGSNFKINDHYSPYYARLAIQEHPELSGFFELRELRAA